MRIEFWQSIDFNQMLVLSTFAHLIALTFILFLPAPNYQERIVVPIFRLDLIELPLRAPSAPPPPSAVQDTPKPGPKIPVTPPPQSPPAAKKLPPPKAVLVESETTRKMLADLESLNQSNPEKTGQSILDELDQLARLSPGDLSKKPPPTRPMGEETFKEKPARKLQDLSTNPQPAVIPPLIDNLLEDLGKSEKKSNAKKSAPVELEFAAMAKQPVDLKSKKAPQTKSDLLKELEAMEKMSALATEIPVDTKRPAGQPPHPVETNSVREKSFQPLLEKLGALEGAPVEIEIDISEEHLALQDFQSGIRRLKIPAIKMNSKNDPAKTLAFSAHEGSPASDVLSVYIGKIYERVYSKWKTPLGAKANEVVVAFTIFPRGNIDKPVVRRSTGEETLDAIAVRAIHDSVPFPPLPGALGQPNLPVSIHFKYVPEKD